MQKFTKTLILTGMISCVFFFSGCDDDEPMIENEEELITDVTLTFTPEGGGNPIVARATDPDGDGPEDISVQETIVLVSGITYTLDITMRNSITETNISEEVLEEGAEHQLFFEWTGEIFSNDEVIYNDTDINGLPIGLNTTWTAQSGLGEFNVILKHQPGMKSESSTVANGATDMDLTWGVEIQ